MTDPGLHIGMGGWDLSPFERTFYPPSLRGFRKLHYYAQFFDFVEVNSTFYNSSFSPSQVQRWIDDVSFNKRFEFSMKLFRGFTHTFDAGRKDFLLFSRLLEMMQSECKLVGVVMQFPASFVNTSDRREYLANLSRAFRSFPRFVEVRHRSWNSPLMFNFFQECGVHLVNVDLPSFPKHMPFLQQAWNGAAYFRMMGRNHDTWLRPYRLEPDGKHMISDRYRYLYGEGELSELLKHVRKLRSEGNKTMVVFHNDPEAQSLLNGFQFKHMVSRRKVFVPDRLVRTFPQLRPVSASVNVSHPLFSGTRPSQETIPKPVQDIPVYHSANY